MKVIADAALVAARALARQAEELDRQLTRSVGFDPAIIKTAMDMAQAIDRLKPWINERQAEEAGHREHDTKAMLAEIEERIVARAEERAEQQARELAKKMAEAGCPRCSQEIRAPQLEDGTKGTG